MNETEIRYIRENLRRKSLEEKEKREIHRRKQLVHVRDTIKRFFAGYPQCHVFLTGSIVKPGFFSDSSDIDVAVENFHGSRLDLFMELSGLFDMPVDLIIMERCHFSDQIREMGVRVC